MSDMAAHTAFDTPQTPGPDSQGDAARTLAHPGWARIGRLLNRAAIYCGTHSAGYVTPGRLEQG